MLDLKENEGKIKDQFFCQNNIKSSLKSALLKEKGPKDKNHVYFPNFLTFSAKIYAETLNTQRTKLNIWILLVFLGKFSFLQVYIHDPLHVCIMYLLNRKVVFGKRYQPKRNFFSSKIEFSFLFGNFGALLGPRLLRAKRRRTNNQEDVATLARPDHTWSVMRLSSPGHLSDNTIGLSEPTKPSHN